MNSSSASGNIWLNESPIWVKEYIDLLQDVPTVNTPAANSNTDEVIRNSDIFPLKFPTDAIRCKTLLNTISSEVLDRNINSTYPIIHESMLHLCAKFLVLKQKNGTETEKNVYKNMSLKSFIHRLLMKKAAALVDPAYEYFLPDGTKGSGNWEVVGSNHEVPPLQLKNCLSYDEMKLSCFVSISSYSYFVNNGARSARGKVEDSRNDIQQEGVVVSLIGPKLIMRNLYEYQDIVLSNQDGNQANILIRELFAAFYKENLFSYEEAKKLSKSPSSRKFKEFRINDQFNNDVYKKRLAVSFDTFLLEANFRAQQNNTTAYVHLVGIGLGVWCISGHQEFAFVETLADRLQVLGSRISYVSDVHLSYFNQTEHCGRVKNGNIFSIPGHPTGIQIHISKREPFTKLFDSGKLLVVSYAADANALPGNEFWKGFVGNSSDSATASSSQVAELHNPYINPLVCADNLKIVTIGGNLVTLPEYVTEIKECKT